MEYNIVMAYVFGLIILLLLGWVLLSPLKMLIKFIYNSILGGLALLLINLLGKFIGISIGINIITAAIVGIFGIPGLILLLVLQYILKF